MLRIFFLFAFVCEYKVEVLTSASSYLSVESTAKMGAIAHTLCRGGSFGSAGYALRILYRMREAWRNNSLLAAAFVNTSSGFLMLLLRS